MPGIAITNDCVPELCPVCGTKNKCVPFELTVPNFGAHNKLAKAAAEKISKDGTFDLVGCTECGFSWKVSPEVANTSQIRWWIMSFVDRALAMIDSDSQVTAFIRLMRKEINKPDEVSMIVHSRSTHMYKLLTDVRHALDLMEKPALVKLYNKLCKTSDEVVSAATDTKIAGDIPVVDHATNVVLVD